MENILFLLSGIRPEFDFTESNDFFGDGYLDSFDLITLVSELDEKYNISIQGIDITPDNFKNVEAINQLLLKYKVN